MSRHSEARSDFDYSLSRNSFFRPSQPAISDNLQALIEIGLLSITNDKLFVFLSSTLASGFTLAQQTLLCLKLHQVSTLAHSNMPAFKAALKNSCERSLSELDLATRLKMLIAKRAMLHHEPSNKSKNEAMQHQAIAFTRFIFNGDSEIGTPSPSDSRPLITILSEYQNAFERHDKGYELTFLREPARHSPPLPLRCM